MLFPPPGYLPDLGIQPMSPASPTLTGGFFYPKPPGKPPESLNTSMQKKKKTHQKTATTTDHILHHIQRLTHKWIIDLNVNPKNNQIILQ